jgi:hypothetical protein
VAVDWKDGMLFPASSEILTASKKRMGVMNTTVHRWREETKNLDYEEEVRLSKNQAKVLCTPALVQPNLIVKLNANVRRI